jgi:uncharacterized protein YndB with AHSA1/START domain
MAIVKLTQFIRRPVEDVFRMVIDVANFPRWNPTTPSARKLTTGATGEGTQFELEIKGFGKVVQELREFRPNQQVRLVPRFKVLTGGHRFLFAAEGNGTRVDHELEMVPVGFFKIFAPVMGMIGRKNLRGTAKALQDFLEGEKSAAAPL